MNHCSCCDYFTLDKSNYKKHLKTKKHLRNNKKSTSKDPEVIQKIYKSTTPTIIQKTDIVKKDIDNNNIGDIEERDLSDFQCPECLFIFKYKQGLWKHKKFNRCKGKIVNDKQNVTNITNITNNTTNNTIHNTINITFNVNSKEEAKAIKNLLTKEKIIEICKPQRNGLSYQSYDIVKKIQDLSLESKRTHLELQNFRKTNVRDDIIDVLENNVFKKVNFRTYNRADLHKFAKQIMEGCEKIATDKSYEEKLDLICEILKHYDHYKNLDPKYHTGISEYILKAIDDCEKKSRMEHYNITIKEE